jgi:SAM-dependent methyltransferase
MLNESSAQNAAFFDQAQLVAAEEEMFRWQAQKAAQIVGVLARLERTERVADVGCFTGRLALEYRRAGVRHIDGYDASPHALEQARARGLNTFLWSADHEPCPAAAETYDVTIAADIIEHLVNTDFFIAELKRITRRGGHIIITTPNLAFWLNRLRLLVGKTPWSYPGPSSTIKLDVMLDTNHIRINTVAEWTHFFQASGLGVEQRLSYTLLEAIEGGLGVTLRRTVDRVLRRWPALAFGTLYVLRVR